MYKKSNEDAHSQAYNNMLYYASGCIKEVYTGDIKEMKDNEVICICSRAYVRTFANNKTGEQVAVNNVNLYCVDIMKVRQINKEFEQAKSLKL